MDQEAAFLREIQSNPRDRATRLIYADWLEERGDPRSELVRVEEEMDSLPAFADRFWELKPRRNKLRAMADPAWLLALGYGTVCRPVFGHGWPDDVKGRWRLIREFVERMARKPMRDAGRPIKPIRQAEGRLRLALPESVREWVAFAHDAGVNDGRHLEVFGDSYTMRMIDDHPALSLLCADEGYYEWAVRLDRLDQADPPVCAIIGDPLHPDLTRRGQATADRLTTFVLAHVLCYHQGEGGRFAGFVADLPRLVHQLETWFPSRCRFEATNLNRRTGDCTLFEADDILVELGRADDRGTQRDLMIVRFARPLPDAAIPAFLWDYARESDWIWGPNGRDQDLPNFHDPDDDDIPF